MIILFTQETEVQRSLSDNAEIQSQTVELQSLHFLKKGIAPFKVSGTFFSF